MSRIEPNLSASPATAVNGTGYVACVTTHGLLSRLGFNIGAR
jgi:hypothetical protein